MRAIAKTIAQSDKFAGGNGTFCMQAKPGGLLIATALLWCGLAGCVARHEPPAAVAPIRAAGEKLRPTKPWSNGTVLVVRADGFTVAGGVLQERARLLRAIDDAGAGAMVALVEVVVRKDDGRTVALMVAPDDEPIVGQRVRLLDGSAVLEISSGRR